MEGRGVRAVRVWAALLVIVVIFGADVLPCHALAGVRPAPGPLAVAAAAAVAAQVVVLTAGRVARNLWRGGGG